jgi:hypothetical protein
MAKAICVPDLKYASRKGRRGNGGRELRRKLKYLTFREDRNGHIPQEEGRERWQDRGMGGSYPEILQRCQALSSSSVLAWTWVIAPAPELMSLVPEDKRLDLVCKLTEEVVESYYEERGVEIPEYSYVIHDRAVKSGDGAATGQQNLHTHIILPGTARLSDGARKPFYNRSEKGHVDLLHRLSTETMEKMLDWYVGPTWRERRREIDLAPQPKSIGDLGHIDIDL